MIYEYETDILCIFYLYFFFKGVDSEKKKCYNNRTT